MSRYSEKPLTFEGLKTVPIDSRGGKVRVEHFARPYLKGGGIAQWLDSLPKIIAGESFQGVVQALRNARDQKRAILWGMGGHVVKCGLADVLLDLMHREWVTAFVMNGAASIHDFEIAIAGQTSEDVEAVLPDGRFGAAEETGREMNRSIVEGDRAGLGMGEALGRALDQRSVPNAAPEASLLLNAYRARVPVTVHVAIGTDTPHTHPAADGAAIGSGTHRDFRLFCSLVTQLHEGGIYLNVGSAVLLPEVF